MARFDGDVPPMRADRVGEGLYYGEVYFVIGKPSETSKDNEVSSPPWAGQGHVLILDKGGKTVTLFAMYQLESFQVSRRCYEYRGIQPARSEFDRDKAVAAINVGWSDAVKFGFQKDFDMAAKVLQMLGAPVPLRTTSEADVKPSGGKEADDTLGLLKPVKRDSKRGAVLAFFLGGPRSIREAMAEFGYSRSNVLSHLNIIQKEHGIGYQLAGDAASVQLPAGCTDPFGAAE